MLHRPILPRALAALLAIFGLALFIPACLPYPALRSFLDALSSDKNFNSLKVWNASIFNLLFGAAGLFFLLLAGLTCFHRWGRVKNFLQNLWVDAGTFFRRHHPQKKEAGFLAAVVLIIALAVVYRLERIVSPMKPDEAYTYVAFGHSLFSALTDYHLPNNHVFHSILVYFSTRLFGTGPAGVRLPAFTAGVLLVPAVYWMGKRFYDRWTGLAAAFLTAWLPCLISYSTNARGYTLVALFTVLTFTLGEVVRREKNTFAWMLIVLFSALGLYTVPVMLFPFGILFVWLLLEAISGDVSIGPDAYKTRAEFFRHWLVSGLAAAGLTLLLYLPILIYTGPQKFFFNQFVTPLGWDILVETLLTRFTDTWREWVFRVPGVYLVLLTAGFGLGLIFHRRVSKVKIPLQAAALGWGVILLLVQRPDAYSKVWLFLLPLMLLWAAAGSFGLLQKVRPHFSAGRPLFSIAVFGVILLAGLWQAVRLIGELPGIWAIKGDEERTVLFVQDHLQENDLIAVAPAIDETIWYYSDLYGIPSDDFNSQNPDFQRLIVLVHLSENQTLDSVILKRGFKPEDLELESARLTGTFGDMQVFEVSRK